MKKTLSHAPLVLAVIVVSISILAMYPRLASAEEGKTLVYNSSGGIVEKVAKQVFAQPFEQKTGTKITFTAPVNFAKLKAMVESGNIEWDITELGPEDMIRGKERGYLEPIDTRFPRHFIPPYLLITLKNFRPAKHPNPGRTSGM
jgi:spermidine/putrescine-binding protein